MGGDGYNNNEEVEIKNVLDGDTLSKEIGGNQLAKEIAEETDGAGIKDPEELKELLHSIKGAEVFIAKTPTE